MRIGVLTGGGDSPGCNALLYSICVRAESAGHDVIAAELGWKGVLEGRFRKISARELKELIEVGGTIIGTSRTNPFKREDGPAKCLENLDRNGVNVLITIGGDDTNGAGYKLFKLGANVVGVPQTIDNDLAETEYAVGFDSALSTATDALDKLKTTARSHRRVIVCEIMGRDAGWLCLYSGLAAGADLILLPESPVSLDEIQERVKSAYQAGQSFAIVAVSEGFSPKDLPSSTNIQEAQVDEFGHVRLGGVGNWLAREIEAKTGLETRSVVLGHLQRGGKPTALERVMAVLLGVKAVEMCEAKEFGKLAVIKDGKPVSVPMEDAFREPRKVPQELLSLTRFFR